MIKITSIRIKKNYKQSENTLGIASINLEDCLIIHNIKLLEVDGKRMVAFPSVKVKKVSYVDGKLDERCNYSDIVHPANREFREYIENELFKVYDMEVNNE